MRLEDELTEAEELELARATETADVEGKEQEEDERAEEVLPLSVRRYTEVVQSVHALVAGHAVDFDRLVDLTQDERTALEDLARLLTGLDGTRFMFAEDRLVALNHTLAVLQPVLGLALHGAGVDALRASFDEVVDEINTIRDHLVSLEGAEDVLFERGQRQDEDEAEDDDDDEGDEGDDSDAGEAAATGAAAVGDAASPAAASPPKKKPRKPKPPPAPVVDAPAGAAPPPTKGDT